jgi:hypothetical protein
MKDVNLILAKLLDSLSHDVDVLRVTRDAR